MDSMSRMKRTVARERLREALCFHRKLERDLLSSILHSLEHLGIYTRRVNTYLHATARESR